jgi:hypothetical protein
VDIYVLAGSIAQGERRRPLRELADYLVLPDHSVVQRSLARARDAGLVDGKGDVRRPSFEELCVHALRYMAPARLGPLTAGVPAAWAAEPMSRLIISGGADPPPVWPNAAGLVRGQELPPLHPACVQAAAVHPELAQLLCLVDSLRVGDVRVRSVAARELHGALTRRRAA